MTVFSIILIIGLIVFVTHALEAVTGFGCTVLAFPFVILVLGDLEQTKIILSVLAWILALYFVVTKFRQINLKQFLVIVGIAGVGLPLGMLVFKKVDAFWLKKILGVFIIISASVQLVRILYTKLNVKTAAGFIHYLYLFLGGVIHGAFATGGPLIVMYSEKKIKNKGSFRATMCLLWAALNTVLMIQYVAEKKLTWTIGKEIFWLLPFLAAGILAGEYIHNKVNELLFRKIVFFSLLLVGIVMVAA